MQGCDGFEFDELDTNHDGVIDRDEFVHPKLFSVLKARVNAKLLNVPIHEFVAPLPVSVPTCVV